MCMQMVKSAECIEDPWQGRLSQREYFGLSLFHNQERSFDTLFGR